MVGFFRQRDRIIFPVALLFVSMALGGGGRAAPLNEMVIELAALALLAFGLTAPATAAEPRSGAIWILLALVVLVPFLQLAPLPYALWHVLPGRAFAADVLGAAGVPPRARPASLAPEATVRAALALIPPIVMFALTSRTGTRAQVPLAAALALAAVASALLGVLQISAGRAFDLYATDHDLQPVGLFANRNHEAALLLLGIPLGAAAIVQKWPGVRRAQAGAAALTFILAIAVLTTTSRMGALLLPIAMLTALAAITGIRRRLALSLSLALAVLALLVIILALFNPIVGGTLARFSDLSDLRPFIWRDTLHAVTAYWPVGSGLGSFMPVFAASEDLDAMGPFAVNHAHNEYLEIALEAGLAGVLLIVGYLVLLARRLAAVRTAASPVQYAALVGIALLLLHSLVDYPLRSASLVVAFAMLNGLLFAPNARRE